MHLNLRTSFTSLLLGLLVCHVTTAEVFAQEGPSICGALHASGRYGPYDYRTDRPKLGVVEDYHFTPAVEALLRGNTSALPGPDLNYTLLTFPNHHRALLAMVRYGEKMKSPQPPGAFYSVECYFERALRFRPDDSMVRMIYATFLSKSARAPKAIKQLEQATVSAGDSAFSHYNIGLIYFDLKEYDRARLQAHKAIELGFPQTALRDKLKSVGKWIEPASESDNMENPTLNDLLPGAIKK